LFAHHNTVGLCDTLSPVRVAVIDAAVWAGGSRGAATWLIVSRTRMSARSSSSPGGTPGPLGVDRLDQAPARPADERAALRGQERERAGRVVVGEQQAREPIVLGDRRTCS
jgi:hypothetical protein